MISPLDKSIEDICMEVFIKRSWFFLEEAFPNLDIYSQCSSFDSRDTMVERDKAFFKDGMTDKFSEAVSRLNLIFSKHAKFTFYDY